MLVTLAVVVFFASIFVFFSQEFIRTFKKIFAIKGIALFAPLLFASWLVFTFDYWILWGGYYYRELLQATVAFLIHIMPFQFQAKSIALIITLTTVSLLPVMLIDFLVKKKTYKSFKYAYFTSTLIWLISAALLLVL